MLKIVTPLLIALHLAVVGSSTLAAQPKSEGDRPNFVIFLTDDLGWGDLACYGHPRIQTPNLDAFAKEGLRLTQCYSACSVCSPSRSSILTGRTPYRNGVFRWIPSGSDIHLRSSEITIATLLQQRGYNTCHVGKWHLNGHFNSDQQPQPNDHGYQHWLATQNNAAPNHLNPTNFVRNGKELGKLEGPSSHIAVEEAINWLKDRPEPSTPFFLTVWTHEPHMPIESTSEFMKPYADLADEGLRQHHGNITQLDAAFGKLMAALKEMNHVDNTFVVFTSDNGPEGNGTSGRTRGSTGGLRGRKRHSYEGGIRVPGIVRWPNHVKPGTESTEPVIGSDLFTTICEVVNIPVPADRTIDGASMLPLFAGEAIERGQPLYWRNHLAPEQQRVAIRVGDWKIIGSDDLTHFELYNLLDDPQETTDRSAAESQRFEAMKAQLIAHDAAVLKEGPSWWKNETPKGGKAKPISAGKDKTGLFEVIKGGTATKTEAGIQLQATGECLALQKLEDTITTQATIRFSYRSTEPNTKIRNAALAFGSEPTNADTVKVGTAIGLGDHVAFQGDWGQVGSLAKVAGKFKPQELLQGRVTIDLATHTLVTTIQGTEFKAALPADLKEIRYLGYYTKGTTTEFSLLEVE